MTTDPNEDASSGMADDQALDAPEEEEQGITRCVCGSAGMLPAIYLVLVTHLRCNGL